MIKSAFIRTALKSTIGRWIIGGAVTLLLSGAALKWYNFKQGLIEEGQQVCIQEINKQTMIDLQDALVAERVTNAELVAKAKANAAVNEEARARLRDSESRVDNLLNQQKEQERNDEEYADWGDNTLPDGIASRLRGAQAGSNPDPVRENGN